MAKLPGLVKYVQHHVVSYPMPGYEQVDDEINGNVETAWESQEAAIAASQTPEMMAVIMGERNFPRINESFRPSHDRDGKRGNRLKKRLQKRGPHRTLPARF